MIKCEKDCFANSDGRCVALETPYEGDCPFQKKISRMMKLFETDSDFACYVKKYMAQHRNVGLNHTLIVKIVIEYGENIIKNKGYDL